MTKKEKQLLRVACAIIQNAIIRDTKKKWIPIDEQIRKHPERFNEEFIKETGFSRREQKELLKRRYQRLKK